MRTVAMLNKAVQNHLGRHLRALYAGAKDRDRNRLEPASEAAAAEAAKAKNAANG